MNLKLQDIVINSSPEQYSQNACNLLNDVIILPPMCAFRAYKTKTIATAKKIIRRFCCISFHLVDFAIAGRELKCLFKDRIKFCLNYLFQN